MRYGVEDWRLFAWFWTSVHDARACSSPRWNSPCWVCPFHPTSRYTYFYCDYWLTSHFFSYRPTKEDHVADTHCKVYDFDNLYVGGESIWIMNSHTGEQPVPPLELAKWNRRKWRDPDWVRSKPYSNFDLLCSKSLRRYLEEEEASVTCSSKSLSELLNGPNWVSSMRLCLWIVQ